MISARSATRLAASRGVRSLNLPKRQIRFQSSTSSSSSTGGSAFSNSPLAAGIAGGIAGAGLFYGIYTFTPAGRTASKLNKTLFEANKKYEEAAKKLQEHTPTSDQAIDSIKQFAYSYVGWVPGGRAYVDAAFKDWETVRQNHSEEADKIISDAYKQLQDASKSGLSVETASKAYEVLADVAKKITSLAGDALSDIVDNHPQVKEKLGGNIDQLKQLGEQYGPEAKKQVDETWSQIKDVLSSGISASNLDKARKLIEEKVQQVKKLGDEAWKKGLEEAKPYLDKNPKVKELVEKNADALKQGNVKELFSKAQSAVESDKLGDLESYINKAVEKVGSKGSEITSGWGDLDKYLKMVPQAEEILPKLQQLGKIAEQHKEEGEKLLKETIEDIKRVLEEKSKKAKDIADDAKKEAK
ncbi:hypothetical protein PT974_10697 [Cladobotryum mycophilum]|uniref:Apolipoprotein/apolipophorin n=1 Tax=Cladobotryum mycophilum TaxID=491253 RepID=A0ABR0SAL8_9HYPO